MVVRTSVSEDKCTLKLRVSLRTACRRITLYGCLGLYDEGIGQNQMCAGLLDQPFGCYKRYVPALMAGAGADARKILNSQFGLESNSGAFLRQ